MACLSRTALATAYKHRVTPAILAHRGISFVLSDGTDFCACAKLTACCWSRSVLNNSKRMGASSPRMLDSDMFPLFSTLRHDLIPKSKKIKHAAICDRFWNFPPQIDSPTRNSCCHSYPASLFRPTNQSIRRFAKESTPIIAMPRGHNLPGYVARLE